MEFEVNEIAADKLKDEATETCVMCGSKARYVMRFLSDARPGVEIQSPLCTSHFIAAEKEALGIPGHTYIPAGGGIVGPTEPTE